MVEIATTAGVVVRLADVVPVREIPDHHHIVIIMLLEKNRELLF